jgi:alpha-1,6-mannosyltransferase
VAAALLYRGAGFFAVPLYEDDFYRYLWDGYVFFSHGTPYGIPPATFFGADDLPLGMSDVLSQVNYPDIPTIYGPVCELLFLLGYTVSPGELWPLKIAFNAADLGLVFVIWRMTRSAAAVVLYAWAPLVVKEVAFTAHPDVVAAFLAALSLMLFERGQRVAAAAMIGGAIASKALAIVLVPFVIAWRDWRAAATVVLVVVFFYGPFLLHGTSDIAGVKVFAAEWEFNSLVFALLKSGFGWNAAKVLSPALFAFTAAALWRWKRDWFQPAVIVALVFVFSPVVNAWYLVLLAPFVALRPSWWGIAAISTVLLSYVTGLNLGRKDIGQFDHPLWVRPAEAMSVLLAAAYDRYRQRTGVSRSAVPCRED